MSNEFAAMEDTINALLARIEKLENALEIIATTTYPARYMGKREDGVKMYGGVDDASRFARQVLDEL